MRYALILLQAIIFLFAVQKNLDAQTNFAHPIVASKDLKSDSLDYERFYSVKSEAVWVWGVPLDDYNLDRITSIKAKYDFSKLPVKVKLLISYSDCNGNEMTDEIRLGFSDHLSVREITKIPNLRYIPDKDNKHIGTIIYKDYIWARRTGLKSYLDVCGKLQADLFVVENKDGKIKFWAVAWMAENP